MPMIDRPRTIIETLFPAQQLNHLHQRHPSDPTQHHASHWKHRVPHAVAKAIISAAVTPAGDDPSEAIRHFLRVIEADRLTDHHLPYATQAVQDAAEHHGVPSVTTAVDLHRALFARQHPAGGVVHDPLAGVGSFPFAAAACGLRGSGVELHPVPYVMARSFARTIVGSAVEYRRWREEIDDYLRGAHEELSDYALDHPHPNGWLPVQYVYVQEILCPQSGVWVPAYSNPVLSKRDGVGLRTEFDPGTREFRVSVVSVARTSPATVTKSPKALRYTIGNDTIVIPWGGLRAKHPPVRDRLIAIQWSAPHGKTLTEPTTHAIATERRILSLTPTRAAIGHMRENPATEGIQREWNSSEWAALYNPRQALIAGALWRHATPDVIPLVWQAFRYMTRLTYWDSHGSTPQPMLSFDSLKPVLTYATPSTQEATRHIKPPPHHPNPTTYTTQQADARTTPPPQTPAIIITHLPTNTTPGDTQEIFSAWATQQDDPTVTWDPRTPLNITDTNPDTLTTIIQTARRTPNPNQLIILTATNEPPNFWPDIIRTAYKTQLTIQTIWRITTQNQKSINGHTINELTTITLTPNTHPQHTYADELPSSITQNTEQTLDTILHILTNTKDTLLDERDITTALYAAALNTLTKHATIDGQPTNELTHHQATHQHQLAQTHAHAWLKPPDLPRDTWETLNPQERYYLHLTNHLNDTPEELTRKLKSFARTYGIDHTTITTPTNKNTTLTPPTKLRLPPAFRGGPLDNILQALHANQQGDHPTAKRHTQNPHAITILDYLIAQHQNASNDPEANALRVLRLLAHT